MVPWCNEVTSMPSMLPSSLLMILIRIAGSLLLSSRTPAGREAMTGLPVLGGLVHPAEGRMRKLLRLKQLPCRISRFRGSRLISSFTQANARTWNLADVLHRRGHGPSANFTLLVFVDACRDLFRHDSSGIGATDRHRGRVPFGLTLLIRRPRAVAAVSRVPSPRSLQWQVQKGGLAGGMDRGGCGGISI